MGIIKLLTKGLTSWYNEKEAEEKHERVEKAVRRADAVVSDAESLIRSYRTASRIIAASRR